MTKAWTRFQGWAGVRQRYLETGHFRQQVPLHLCVGTNLDMPDSVLPLGYVELDSDRKWTSKVKLQILCALEGKLPQVNLEELDAMISKGLSVSQANPEATINDKDNLPCANSDEYGKEGHQSEDDEGERLTRMFEAESEISSSDDEQDDARRCSVQVAQDLVARKRQKEAQAWRSHIENSHVPFRRDCQHCVLGSAINMQHRRVRHPTSYTLSVDLFGPLQPHERGRDEESVSGNPHLKYGLVGAFRLPRCVVDAHPALEDQDGCLLPDPSDHLSDYEPSEPGDPLQQPLLLHETLGEVSPDLFDELFGDADPLLPDVAAGAVQGATGDREGSDLKLPWDDEVIPSDDDFLMEHVEKLKVPVEQVVLRFVVGLKSKSGADVAAGIQRLVLDINREYPVRVLHCDPGTEFTSDRLKTWLLSQGVRLQHTLPTDKRSNGLAERTVGLLKARARTLLSSTRLSAQYWPLAMRYACETHNRRALGKLSLPVFGQEVLHRVKKPSGALNELMNRWVKARYMTPHLSIPEGHVLITGEGNLVASKGFRAGAVDTNELEDLDLPILVEEEELTCPESEENQMAQLDGQPEQAISPPKVRFRSKSKVRFLEVAGNRQDLDEIAKEKLLDEDYTEPAFIEVVEALQKAEVATKDRRGEVEGRYILGAFCHGGKRGVSNVARKYPNAVKFLNKFLRSRLHKDVGSQATWSTILLAQATDIPVRRDCRNEWGTKNFVLHVPGKVDLWTSGAKDATTLSRNAHPDWHSGDVRTLSRCVEAFDARNFHAVRRTPGWFIVGYSPLGVHKIQEQDRSLLSSMCFQLPCLPGVSAQVMVVHHSRNDSRSSVEDDSPVHLRNQPSSSSQPFQAVTLLHEDLSVDLQEDSVTPIVGWDPTRDPANLPELNLEEMSLESYLANRGVSGVYHQLELMGVESPADLPFLYREDLVEFGVPEFEARLIMKGIHPEGTLRPDNPNLCALRTGEVRLLDRGQRQLPWVIQNRTLDWRSPGPPVDGLGIRTPDGGQGPRLVDWELEEARRRGELPNLFEEADEELPTDPTDSVRSQGEPGRPSSSVDAPGDGCSLGYIPEQLNMLYMQQTWEDDEWRPLANCTGASSSTVPGAPLLAQSTSVQVEEELPTDPTVSVRSQVHQEYECRAVRVTQQVCFR